MPSNPSKSFMRIQLCICFCLASVAPAIATGTRFGWGKASTVVAGETAPGIFGVSPNLPTVSLEWPAPTETPAWLEAHQKRQKQIMEHRRGLEQIVDFQINQKSLKMVALFLAESTGVPFFLNQPEMDLLGIDQDMPVSLTAKTTLAEFLALMLDPLELTYQIRRAGIEITSKDAADSDPLVECYDMRLVLPSTDFVRPLLNTIIVSIDPDSWLSNGGTSSIMVVGPAMIVAAPESTHNKLRQLLSQLEPFRKHMLQSRLETQESSDPPELTK